MLAEQLLFAVIAFAFFVELFFKLFRKNDTTYVIVLIFQAIGIGLNFLEVLSEVKLNVLFLILKYIMAIAVPLFIIILEKQNKPLIEIVNLGKAKLYFNYGQNKKAKQQLIQLLSKYPENHKGHKLLAEIYEQEGGMRKAIDEYVQAIDSNKKDYDSYYKVAELLNQLEKPDEASEMLVNLLNKKPEYEKATKLLGDILIEQERYKEAAMIYQDALKYKPLDFDLNYNLGIVFTMLNDFQSAKQYYETAAQINSLVYNAKYSLAEIALIYKELAEAEKYFHEVLDDEELAPDAYYELAKIALVRGEKDIAIQYANTAIDAHSQKIVPKIKKDPIFIPILAKLSIPFNIEENEQNQKHQLTKKERKVKQHLEEMFEITRHLSYYDITQLSRNTKLQQQETKEQSQDKER